MPLSARLRRFLPGPLPLLGLAVALGMAASASAAEPLPTDTCVARKLDAAARACKDLLFVESRRSFRPERPGGEGERGGEGRALDAQTEQILARLARSWRRAEWIASREGADCRETTVEVEELAGLVTAAASDLAGVLEEALGTGGPDAARASPASGSCAASRTSCSTASSIRTRPATPTRPWPPASRPRTAARTRRWWPRRTPAPMPWWTRW